MIATGPNLFYTVPLSVTLWFLDRGKRGTPREDTVLFLDARNVFRQVDRAHRDFLPEQIELLANTVRLYRDEDPESVAGSGELMAERFPDGAYADVPGFCRVATIEEIEDQGWSLNPGRYVGAAPGAADDGDLAERLAELHAEFTVLSDDAERLRRGVDAAVRAIVEP
jgi:type I restriction enzyme M protein